MEDKSFVFILLVVLMGIGIYAYSTFGEIAADVGRADRAGSGTADSPLARSLDGGKTFQAAAVHRAGSKRNFKMHDIQRSPEDKNILYAATNKGLLISKDGGTNWYPYADPEGKLNAKAQLYGILPIPHRNSFFVSAFENRTGYLYEASDNFFNIKTVAEFKDVAIYSMARNGSNVYLGLSDGRILEYFLDDSTFRSLAALGSAITDISAKKDAIIYAATKKDGIFGSFDGGDSFKLLNGDLASYPGAKTVTAIGSEERTNALYAASLYGLARTNDNGGSWTILNTIVPKKTPVTALTVTENGHIYAASGSILYTSKDHGLHWEVSRPLSNEREISVINVMEQTIIIGTNG